MLCQLSYTHRSLFSAPGRLPSRSRNSARLARQKGFEPLTHGLEGRCSFHLSYWRESGRADLNGRPPAPKAGALPGCATPRAISNNTRPWRPQPHIRHGDVATRSRSGTRRCGVKSKIETADAMRSKLHCTPGLAPDPTRRKFQALKIKASV